MSEHINVPMAFRELILVHINSFHNVIAQNCMYCKKICFKDSKITTHQILIVTSHNSHLNSGLSYEA